MSSSDDDGPTKGKQAKHCHSTATSTGTSCGAVPAKRQRLTADEKEARKAEQAAARAARKLAQHQEKEEAKVTRLLHIHGSLHCATDALCYFITNVIFVVLE